MTSKSGSHEPRPIDFRSTEDPELVDALITAASAGRTHRRVPVRTMRIEGEKPLRVAGLSEHAQEALTTAGYRDAESLAAFRIADLGGDSVHVTLKELDRLHEVRTMALLKEAGLSEQLTALLARSRITPFDVIGLLQECGTDFVLPGRAEVPDATEIDQSVIDRLKDHLKERIDPNDPGFKAPIDPDDLYAEVDGMYGSVTDHRVADLITGGRRQRISVQADAESTEKLIDKAIASGEVGRALALAQGYAARGDRRTAARMAARAASHTGEMTQLDRYQAEAVAPALLASMVAKDSPDLALRAANRALRAAVPGTRAATESARIVMRALRREAARVGRASGPSRGPGARTARKMRQEQLIANLTAGGLDPEARAASTIPMQTCAALLDLMRANAVAVTMGGRGGMVAHPSDEGMDGRIMPNSGAAYMMGSGGLGALGDPIIRADILDNWGTLLGGGAFLARYGSFLSTIQGDLFRFDYLLGEIRALLDDIAKIEALLFNLVDMVLEQGLAIVADVDDVLSQIIDEINRKVDALAEQIKGLVAGLVTKLREAAFLNAVTGILANWPPENWQAMFAGISTNIGAGQSLDDAILNALRDMLQAEIPGVMDGIADDLQQTLDGLTQRIHDRALPSELQDRLTAYLDTVGLDTAAVVATVRSALDTINLRNAEVQGMIDEIRGGPAFPDWVLWLLATYIVAPFIAGILAVLPAVVAFGLLAAPVLFFISLAISGAMALGALPAFVLQALFGFLVVFIPQLAIAAILQMLAVTLGQVTDMLREVERVKAQITGLVEALQLDLANLGMINSLLDAVLLEVDAIRDMLPADVIDTLHDALVGARSVIEDNVKYLLCAAERSFFRETLELVDVSTEASLPTLEPDQKVAGLTDVRLGSSATIAAALSTFERTRVARALQPPQLLTHVFSLRQLIEYQNVFITDTTELVTGAGRFQQLMDGLPLPFSITADLLDTLEPGLHRALIKDVQLHIDFDLDSVGFAEGGSAAVAVEDQVTAVIIASSIVDLSKKLKDITGDGIGSLAEVTLDNRIDVLDEGLQANATDADTAALLAQAIAAGADELGIDPRDYATSAEPISDLIAAGMNALELGDAVELLEAAGSNPQDVMLSALSTAGVTATGRHIELDKVIEAGLTALDDEPLAGMTIDDVVQAGLDALDISLATGVLMESARAIAGDAADAALDGRIPGGGFPALPVAAGRIPTGMPAVLTHGGVSRVRIKPGNDLIDLYADSCGNPLQSCDLPCALQFTRLIDDEYNPEAAEAGWKYLEFCDPPARQVFSHFHVLADGVRFVVPEKQVKPFEYRGLIGDWTLDVPALANESVLHRLPPIRDIRLIVSAIAHYDADLAPKVAKLPVSLTEPPVPTMPPLPVLEAVAAVEDTTGLDLTTLQATIEQALAELNATLSGAIADLSSTVNDALADVTSEIGRVRTGVDSLLDVSQILAAVANQLAAVTGLTDPLSSVEMLTIDSTDLTNATNVLAGTATNTGWTISAADLTAAGIDPATVLRVVSVAIVPVAAGSLLGVTWPTGTGSLTAPGAAPQSLSLASGSALLPSSVTDPTGSWSLTLPSGVPALTDLLVTLFLEVAE